MNAFVDISPVNISPNFRESLILPKAKTTLNGIDTFRYIGKKIMAGTANRIERVPITRDFQTNN